MLKKPYHFVFPDEFLQNQICTNCEQYLSCGPVKTYVRGSVYEVRCGRCVKDNDGGCISLVNKLFENAYFPCANRLEGCNSLVAFKETQSHEMICRGTKIPCPICISKEFATYSLKRLISHFKSTHWKNFLNQPVFNIIFKEITSHYLYYDHNKNLFVLIGVEFKDKSLIFKIRSSLKSSFKHRIIIYNGSLETDSNEIYRSRFNNGQAFSDTFPGLVIPLVLIESCTQLLCKIEFSTIGNLKLQHLELDMNIATKQEAINKILVNDTFKEQNEFPSKFFPAIYRDENFKEMFGETYLRNYVLSYDFTNLTDRKSGQQITVICYFCENFLATSGNNPNIYFCEYCMHTFCGQCNSYGIQHICPQCQRNYTIKISGKHAKYYNLYYYCKFKCGQYYKAWELLTHEYKCKLNKNRDLTDEENVALYFGVAKRENDIFHQQNSIMFDRSKFWKKGKIYVVTRDDVRFHINFSCHKDQNVCEFKVSHKYNNHQVIIKSCVDGFYDANISDDVVIPLDAEFAFFVVIFKPL